MPENDGSPAVAPRWWAPENRLTRITLPVLVFLLFAGIGAWLFRSERVEVVNNVHVETGLVREQLARRIERTLGDRFRPLRRMGRDVMSGVIDSPPKFQAGARSVQSQIPDYEQLIWVNSAGICIGDSNDETDQKLIGTRIVEVPEWSPLKQAGNHPREMVLALPHATAGRHLFVVFLSGDNGPAGMLAARLRVSAAMDNLFERSTSDRFAMQLVDDAGQSVLPDDRQNLCPAEYRSELEPVRLIDKTWRLRLWPKPVFISGRSMRDAWLELSAMAALGVVFAICAWQALERLRRTRAHNTAIAALNNVAAAATDSPEQSQLALQRVSELAAEMLHMPILALNLLNPDGHSITVVYRRGVGVDMPRTYPLDELAATSKCLATGELVFEHDLTTKPDLASSSLAKLAIKSFVVLPLIVQRQPVGTISLFDRRPRRFSNSELSMAMLWAAHAAIIVRSAELYRRIDQSRRAEQRLNQQRETLYQVNLQIQQSQSMDDALQRIADLAPGALEMEACAVALPADAPGEFRVASITRLDPPFPLQIGRVGRRDHVERAIRTGKPVPVINAANDPSMKEIDWPIGSALYIPLIGGSEAIGVMALYRRQADSFPPEQIQLAELFAARAAVAVENFRLLDQTRADAQTKAILLRELNHRVKNNLAGIVGLLSTSPADITAESRRWLDRVIDRIEAMAGVQELFVNGTTSVTLSQLVRQTIGTIDAIRPPDVKIHLELDPREIKLRTDRAVTLAMVLHELFFNALRHGIHDRGTITVCTRVADDGTLTIEVIDDGGGAHFADARTSSVDTMTEPQAGIGLSLVRGLVTRELRGEFELRARPQGGTSATIRICGAERNSS